MKRVIIAAAAVALFATTVAAEGAGSAFGALSTGRAIGQGAGYFSVGIGAADLTSVVGQFDYGMSRFTTMRLKFGFADAGGNTDLSAALGAEFRWQLWSTDSVSRNQFDMSLGGLFEYYKFDYGSGSNFSVLQLGGFVLGSYGFKMSNGRMLSPYGRFNIRVEDKKVEVGTLSGSNSDLEFGFNGGVSYELTETINAYGEIQLDGNDGFFFGLEFMVM